MERKNKQDYKLNPCNVCGKKEHVSEAKYCTRCGTKLGETINHH